MNTGKGANDDDKKEGESDEKTGYDRLGPGWGDTTPPPAASPKPPPTVGSESTVPFQPQVLDQSHAPEELVQMGNIFHTSFPLPPPSPGLDEDNVEGEDDDDDDRKPTALPTGSARVQGQRDLSPTNSEYQSLPEFDIPEFEGQLPEIPVAAAAAPPMGGNPPCGDPRTSLSPDRCGADLLSSHGRDIWEGSSKAIVAAAGKKDGPPQEKASMPTKTSQHGATDEAHLGPPRFEPTAEELDMATNPRAREALDKWYQRLKELYEYKQQHGHCNVPQKYQPNPQLGTWVNKQREEKKFIGEGKTSMNRYRVEALEKLGFSWSKKKGQSSWDTRYEELVAFHCEHGHCDVPTKSPNLGRWVSTQRSQYKEFIRGEPTLMTQYRLDKLKELGFNFILMRRSDDDDGP